MIKNATHAILSFLSISILILSVSSVSGEVPILDENGNETGLINLTLMPSPGLRAGFRK